MADLIRYDLLVQDALRGVVRQVLTDVARNGLQGEHHFFITFKTATPGLRLSNRMRERYPDEMTIILQHQFWGLTVTDAGFEVGLSFNNAPERLFVPFASITMFQDPSVTFGLKFDPKDATSPAEAATKPVLAEAPRSAEGPKSVEGQRPAEGPKALPGKRALATVETNHLPARLSDAPPRPAGAPKDKAGDAAKPKPVLAKVADAKDDEEGDKGGGPKVVSIDAFRKKP